MGRTARRSKSKRHIDTSKVEGNTSLVQNLVFTHPTARLSGEQLLELAVRCHLCDDVQSTDELAVDEESELSQGRIRVVAQPVSGNTTFDMKGKYPF